ncbi:MAG TPA: cache domain-containing protein [Candidatus Sulfotelmatobacter sp.]|jgi:signal transduction histidine kinase|nr:cache domain-containing protein [Candidatus Sulfotelmatobacter sp.]
MMLRTLTVALLLGLLALAPATRAVAAPDHPAGSAPTVEDAKALVLKASDELSKAGFDAACAEFMQKAGAFWQDDLYVFVMDFDGVWRCYPPKPDAAGMQLILLQDVEGKFFIQEMIDLAKSAGEGWVDYKWKNPRNGLIQLKTSFIKRVGGYVVAAGIFR